MWSQGTTLNRPGAVQTISGDLFFSANAGYQSIRTAQRNVGAGANSGSIRRRRQHTPSGSSFLRRHRGFVCFRRDDVLHIVEYFDSTI